jgi:hypothetical protein
MRKRFKDSRKLANDKFPDWSSSDLQEVSWQNYCEATDYDTAGVFLIKSADIAIYTGATDNLRATLSNLRNNSRWASFDTDSVLIAENSFPFSSNAALKSILVRDEAPLLNVCHRESTVAKPKSLQHV